MLFRSGVAVLSTLVMVLQVLQPERFAASDVMHVVVWGAVLVVSNLAVMAEAISRSRWAHGGMAQAMLGSAVRGHAPFGVVSAIIAIGICRFAPEAAWIVPGIWLLLIALVAITSGGLLPRRTAWAGLWYGVCGTRAAVLAGRQGSFSGWMMGAPLALGHLLIAWILREEETRA